MKQFKYTVCDEFGVVRNHDRRWDAYNHARSDSSLKVIVNPIPKPNPFLEAFKALGEARL